MSRTAYLYDEVYLEHDSGFGHPECPERLLAIDSRLRKSPFYNDLVKIKAKKAKITDVEMVHRREYIEDIQVKIEGGIRALDPDTIVGPKSFEVALYAVGGCLAMCDAVMKGQAENGFCAVRPPGHHAEWDYAAGFCLFNNIAIAARYLQREYGLERIAIFDWDVHHGNGTQHTFEEDDSVYYISFHQYPHYPGTGSRAERGRGKGKGYTLNFPMHHGAGDDDYFLAFREEVVPALEEFRPQIILISAGFDAHFTDALSSIRLSTDAYENFTLMLKDIAARHSDGRVIAFLEGGYNLDTLSQCVKKVIEAFVKY
jgi:acetoin utilization deacetylase AcuC-like enzyme